MRIFIIVWTLFGLLPGLNAFVNAGELVADQPLSTICAACHGADGNSANPIWPNLAGQHAAYTFKQLQNFKSGERQAAQMAAMVVGLSEQDMADLAAYYASQTIRVGAADSRLVGLGQTIYRAGDIATGLPACIGCHGPAGTGNPVALYPSLGGQHAAYTVIQLKAFKLEQRDNDKNSVMRSIAARMTNAQMEAVAEYMQGLHSSHHRQAP